MIQDPGTAAIKRPAGGALRLDRLDLKILTTLQVSGRMTNLELAKMVGISATPCAQRVKRMESAGCIEGYGAKLDIDRLASNMIVLTEILLRNHQREDFLRFERGIQDVPHILNCFLVTGGYDYLVQFIARDILDYQNAVQSLVNRDLGVEKYISYVAIKQVKRSSIYPLSLLLDTPD